MWTVRSSFSCIIALLRAVFCTLWNETVADGKRGAMTGKKKKRSGLLSGWGAFLCLLFFSLEPNNAQICSGNFTDVLFWLLVNALGTRKPSLRSSLHVALMSAFG